MKLLLMRHGIAENSGPGITDAQRRLTGEGQRLTRLALQGLSQIVEAPAAIVTSPLTRAVETATIAAELFAVTPQAMPELAGHDAAPIIAALTGRKEPVLLAVGHEPTLSAIVERLCTAAACGFVEFGRAGCACVEADWGAKTAHPGKLLWFATPHMLRELAKKR